MITHKDVEHIVNLARIELTDQEQKKFEKELSAILGFVEKLNEVDTAGVEPLTGGTLLENMMREDEQIDDSLEGKSSVLMEAVPEKKDGWVKVKAVFQ